MNKHEYAKGLTNLMLKKQDKIYWSNYVDECEATEKRLQELEKDVQRYRELDMAHSYLTPEEHLEYLKLDVKFSKVGVRNEI